MSQEPEADFHEGRPPAVFGAKASSGSLCGILPLDLLQPRLRQYIEKQRPEIHKLGVIGLDELSHLHARWLTERFNRELKKIEGESDDPEDLRHPDVPDIYVDFGHKASYGEKIADRMARIGGSWGFIIGFILFLAAWITVNTLLLRRAAFDEYPFILLNLALSMIAALQAPVIMMSQNRQERMDRLRSEHDFRVNLRSELELRSLHAKVDRLMSHQWQCLNKPSEGEPGAASGSTAAS